MKVSCDTKREIRSALTPGGKGTIRAIEFGDWDGHNGGEGECSSIILHMSGVGLHSIEISATSYGKLKIEEVG